MKLHSQESKAFEGAVLKVGSQVASTALFAGATDRKSALSFVT